MPEIWPACPECHLPRQTLCPYCRVSATHFPIGDTLGAGEESHGTSEIGGSETGGSETVVDESTVLICDTCDEPFQPKFYRHCASCGFDFGNGLEVAVPRAPREELTGRAMLVFAGLGVLAVVFVAYFAWVLRD